MKKPVHFHHWIILNQRKLPNGHYLITRKCTGKDCPTKGQPITTEESRPAR